MRKNASAPTGTVHRLDHDSALLAGNAPGDPARRVVEVYTPPGYDPSRRYPLLVDLAGYIGSGRSHSNWKPFGLSLPERMDRLIHHGMPPAVVVLPDLFTCYGGNQYINSEGTGPYMDHLCDELVPLVESRFAAGGRRENRGIFGKSSGGYGALMHGMLRPETWAAIACHSGDMGFEYCYIPDFSVLLTQIDRHGSLDNFLEWVWSREKLKHDETTALMIVGMAAHYDGDSAATRGFHLPFHARTGRILPARWARWCEWDPVQRVAHHVEALRSLRLLYLDIGRRDQYRLLWGARQLKEQLDQHGLVSVYEEFDDDHSDIDYRLDRSLPLLVGALDSALAPREG